MGFFIFRYGINNSIYQCCNHLCVCVRRLSFPSNSWHFPLWASSLDYITDTQHQITAFSSTLNKQFFFLFFFFLINGVLITDSAASRWGQVPCKTAFSECFFFFFVLENSTQQTGITCLIIKYLTPAGPTKAHLNLLFLLTPFNVPLIHRRVALTSQLLPVWMLLCMHTVTMYYILSYILCILLHLHIRLYTLDEGRDTSWTVVAVWNAKFTNVWTHREAGVTGITGKSSR